MGKAIRNHELPRKITIDQNGANTAAIKHDNRTHKTAIVIRHSKYLIAVFSCMHPLPGARASHLPTNCPEKQPMAALPGLTHVKTAIITSSHRTIGR